MKKGSIKAKIPFSILFILVIALILVILKQRTNLLTQIQNNQKTNPVKQIASNLQIGWKEYNNSYLTLKYPGDWQVEETRGWLSISDPKECYRTGSRPPVKCNRALNFNSIEFSNKSAKQYVDNLFTQNEKERDTFFDKYLGQGYPKDKRTDLNPSLWYEQPILLLDRERIENGSTEIELYTVNVDQSYRSYGRKQLSISNGKVFVVGEGTFKSINDGSIESLILKSVVLK